MFSVFRKGYHSKRILSSLATFTFFSHSSPQSVETNVKAKFGAPHFFSGRLSAQTMENFPSWSPLRLMLDRYVCRVATTNFIHPKHTLDFIEPIVRVYYTYIYTYSIHRQVATAKRYKFDYHLRMCSVSMAFFDSSAMSTFSMPKRIFVIMAQNIFWYLSAYRSRRTNKRTNEGAIQFYPLLQTQVFLTYSLFKTVRLTLNFSL